MNRDFWFNTWNSGQIGFHLPTVNPRLVAHHAILPSGRVFVPLCGKTLDLKFLLDQRREVVGIELSELAVRALFEQHGFTPHVEQRGKLLCFQHESLTVYCGDFFDLQPAQLGSVAALYDRAALVALPPDVRKRYAAHMQRLVGSGAVGLLVAFHYPAHEMSGPPFSVSDEEVHALYEPAFRVELLEEESILDAEPRFRARGLTSLQERVYRLRRVG